MRTETITSIHEAERGRDPEEKLQRVNLTAALHQLEQHHLVAPATKLDTSWLFRPDVDQSATVEYTETGKIRTRFSVECLPVKNRKHRVRLKPRRRRQGVEQREQFIVSVTPEEYTTCAGEIGIREIDATLAIGRSREAKGEQVAPAVLVGLNGIQGVNDHKGATFSEGQYTLIQDTIESAQTLVRESDVLGKFKDGVLETYNPPTPMSGDKIQVFLQYFPGRSSVSEQKGVYLLRPSEERRQKYELQRNLVRDTLARIAATDDPIAIRVIRGNLLTQSLYKTTPSYSFSDAFDLSVQEMDELDSLIQKKLPDEGQRPLSFSNLKREDIFIAENFRSTHNVDNLYSMSVQELFDLCITTVGDSGKQEKVPTSIYKLSAFIRIFQQFLSTEQHEAIWQYAAGTHIPRNKKDANEYRSLLFTLAVKNLGLSSSPQTTETLLTIASQLLTTPWSNDSDQVLSSMEERARKAGFVAEESRQAYKEIINRLRVHKGRARK